MGKKEPTIPMCMNCKFWIPPLADSDETKGTCKRFPGDIDKIPQDCKDAVNNARDAIIADPTITGAK